MTGPQGWRPPDDDWDRPLIGLRTAWLVGFGLVIGGLAAAAIGLVALLGGDSSAGAGWLGFGVATEPDGRLERAEQERKANERGDAATERRDRS